jgi:hypothetical protein
VTEVRFDENPKAAKPIEVTLSGITIEVIPELLKAA